MNNFNLKKYLAEGKLFEEELTPLQKYIFNYEKDISDEVDMRAIKGLENANDVYDYYANVRGWEGDPDLEDDLDNIYRQVKARFAEGKLNEEMDGGTLFDYFNKNYIVDDHFHSDDSYIVKREPSGKDQYVIFDYDKDRDQFQIRQLGGYQIDRSEAIKAGMKETSSLARVGMDAYMVDGNYSPTPISIEGLKDIVDHVMGGLDREAAAQQDYYARRGPVSGTIDEAEAEDLEKSFEKDVPQFVGDLNQYVKDPKVQAILKGGLADGDPNDDKLPYSRGMVSIGNLKPTQNEIDFTKSIQHVLDNKFGSLNSILDGSSPDVGNPIVTYGDEWIIDGHHRWSQVLAANPKAKMDALIIKPKAGVGPKDILKAVHGAIAATIDKVPSSSVDKGSLNVLTAGEDQVRAELEKMINNPSIFPASSAETWAQNGFDTKEKVVDHLVNNLKKIRRQGYLSGGPGRQNMPQTDVGGDIEDKLNALAQGKVNIKEPFTEIKLTDLLNEVIKDKSDKRKEIEIDLTGPDGNAYALLGYASKFAKQLNLDFNKIKDEMTSGDYENLVSTFDKYFGSFVTLYR